MLSSYSPHQIEMAVTASLLQLDLLSPKKIKEYADNLLMKGYYDDALLETLDVDPLYPNPERNLQQLLEKVLSNLGYPQVTNTQARWVYSFDVMSLLTMRPHDFNLLVSEVFEILSYFEISSMMYVTSKQIQEFQSILYNIEHIDSDYYSIDIISLYKQADQFFILCEQ